MVQNSTLGLYTVHLGIGFGISERFPTHVRRGSKPLYRFTRPFAGSGARCKSRESLGLALLNKCGSIFALNMHVLGHRKMNMLALRLARIK